MLFDTQIISANDVAKLTKTVGDAGGSWANSSPSLDVLRRHLWHSNPVPANQVPHDMITMNSRFILRDDYTGETTCYELVYPEDEAPHRGKLSVLSPMGTALYGARIGETVCWMSLAAPEVATVSEILYQPEAAGHKH